MSWKKIFLRKANWFSDLETTSSTQYHMLHEYNPLWKIYICKSKKNGTRFEQQFPGKWEPYCWYFMPCCKVNIKKTCGNPFCDPYYLLHWAGTSVQSLKIKYVLLLNKWTFVSCSLYVHTLPPSSAGVCFSLLGI